MNTPDHGALRIFSTGMVDSEEESRGPGTSSGFFLKDKDSTHKFNNKGQNCMELMIYLLDPRVAIACWILSPLLPVKAVIFGCEKDQ